MSNTDDFDPPDDSNAVLVRLLEQDRAVRDPEKVGALRELLRNGIPVGKAANHLGIPVPAAWRMVTSDKTTQKALDEGDKLRSQRLRARLEARADQMLQVIIDIAQNQDEKGEVRLKAAQDILDRTGLLDKNAGGGKGVNQAGAIIEVTSVEPEFGDRLRRITVKAGAQSSEG